MGQNSHTPDSPQFTQNQNNRMSDDPADGSRGERGQKTGGKPMVEKAPPHDEQDQSTIEAFGEEGAGQAAKE